jgi:PAB-dependent poly(A)-specific ribonuclease subunit 2
MELRARDERFQNLTSMAFTSRGTSEMLVGGGQLQMYTVNLERGTIGSEVRVRLRFESGSWY